MSRRTPEEVLGLLGDWVLQHGAALKPTAGSADTFGDGMRAAKDQVARILALTRAADTKGVKS